ncbi:hypothetical protein ILUMI_03898 [Ignelater luminosus]|uniref:Retrovirus-related Pol polyprotein from transposon TNT 1-94 n=1 Tax=Ignelater luminosus TaxID=2038154 RepID=A0A8K0DKV0_IGNLU|nr:hypothetical protein ILUMI_03898 [Ignelater luminosus]
MANKTVNNGRYFRFKCHNCGQEGHKRAECRRKEHTDSGKRNANNTVSGNCKDIIVFVAESCNGEKRDANNTISGKSRNGIGFKANLGNGNCVTTLNWFLDSGATDHMTNSESYFAETWELQQEIKISVAKCGEAITARKAGNVREYLVVNGKMVEYLIKNVLFVPKLQHNLIYITRLKTSGLKTVFKNSKAVIYNQSGIVGVAKRQRGLYQLKVYLDTKTANANLSLHEKEDLWHKRYGRIGYESLQKIINLGMVNGIEMLNIKNTEKCETCIYGKMTKLPHKDTRVRANEPLELIHTDICGPITPEAWNGKKYFVTFTDDYTHFNETYIFERKCHMFEKFQDYEAKVSNRFKKGIVRISCDNGGEYLSNEFKEFCRKRGINIEYTIPYTPEQNGVSERMNRTILDKARTMVLGSHVFKHLWSEAVCAAVYIINKSPTTALQTKRLQSSGMERNSMFQS